MTSVLSHPIPHPRADRDPPPLPDVPARALRGPLRHQPVDGPAGAGRPGPGAAPVGAPCATPTSISATGSTSCRRCPACRTWSSRPTGPPCSTAPCSAPGSGTASGAPRPPRTGPGSPPPASDGSWRPGTSTRARATCWSPAAPGDRGRCSPAPASAPTRGRTPRRPPCWAARCCRWSWSTRATTTWTPRWRCSTATPSPGCRRPSRRRSRELLASRFPDAIVADPADAAVLGLNAVSDGRHVVLPAQAPRLAATIAERGFEPDPGRPVRAAQGRRRGQVLHAGGAWMSVLTRDGHRAARALVAEHSAHNYHPLPVVVAHAAGRLGHRRRGPPLPGLPGRLLRAQLRARAPGAAGRRAPAAGPGHADQPGVRQRPARPVLRGARGSCSASRWCCP